MQIKPHALGIAFASTTGILYILCAVIIALSPRSSMSFFNYFFHGIDLTKIATSNVSWGSFFLGLILSLLVSYIGAFIFGLIYNRAV